MEFAGDVATFIILGLQQAIRQFAQLIGLLQNFGVTLFEFLGTDLYLFFEFASEGSQLYFALAQGSLGSLTFSNIARYLGGANRLARGILHRRNCQRDVQQGSIFAPA